MLNVAIIGVGRVGGALAFSLPSDKYRVSHLIDRRLADIANVAEQVPYALLSSDLDVLAKGAPDLVLLTTQDTELKSTIHDLTGKVSGATVLHTSGSTPSSVLDSLKTSGNSIGSIHPLVSISSPELGPERFPGAFFCIEGDAKAVEIGRQIATDLGGRPFTIDTRFKTLYHASAVTACGHLVALFDAAVEMMTKCGLSAEESSEILLPLVSSTMRNLEHQTTAEALTGTFARADTETLTRHLTALNENVSDDLLEIYLLLGERSLELAAKQGVSPERIDKMRSKVAVAKSKLKW
jgi:predicted short-subunit dehydrogenase-like oxidoreductase (DUF2520 family)